MPAKYKDPAFPTTNLGGKLQFANPGGLGTGAFSFEGLFYLRDFTVNQYLFHMQAGAGASPNTIIFVDTTGKLNFWVNGGGARVSSTTVMVANRWYRVVGTCNNLGSGNTICRMWLDETESDYTAVTAAVGVGTHTGDVNIGGRNYDSGARNILDGMAHKVRIYNTVLDPTHIQTRKLDLATQYAANLVFKADLDSNLNGLNSTGAATTGTATNCTLQQWPVDMTRMCGWYRQSDPGNINASGRYSTVLDLSGCGNNVANASSTGPFRVTTGGLGIEHAWFDGSATYLEKSAGAFIDKTRNTIVAFAGSYNTPWGANRTLACVGTLASTDSEVTSLGVKTGTGQPNALIAGTEMGLHTLAHSTTPRLIAWSASNGTDAAIQTDDRWLADAVIGTGTDDDLRVGASMGGTPGEFWYGDLYELFVFQESYNEEGDLDDLHALGITRGYYAAATKLIAFEGSSTGAGFGSTLGNNLPALCADTLSDAIVLNYSNNSENRTHFSTNYATQPGSSYALGWFDKADRALILQAYGNDYDGSTAYATILAGYQAIVTTVSGDYARIGHWEAHPRGSVGAGLVDDANIADRERDRWAFIDGLTGVYRMQFDLISELDQRPAIAQNTDDDNEVADRLHDITTGVHYAGDEIHLDDSGFALLAAQFDARYAGLFVTSGGAAQGIAAGRKRFVVARRRRAGQRL